MNTSTKTNLIPVLIAGSLIVMVGFAIRASFGVFQIPIADEFGWLRSEFSLAIAIQNLFWGIGTPIFGAIADKFGDRKAIVAGAICYALGLLLSAYSTTPEQHQLLEMLVGFGIAGTGFGVVLAVIGRAANEENRSMALGIGTAAGSAGQIIGPITAEFLLGFMPWQTVFMVFAIAILATLAAVPFLTGATSPKTASVSVSVSVSVSATNVDPMAKTIKKAISDPTYTFIFLGFFSCGYQLAFLTAHFPAFITEICGPISPSSLLSSVGITTTSSLGALAIAVIGFANIFGTLAAGWLGQKYSRKYLLAGIYLSRALVAAIFVILPMTPTSVLVFSAVMGALWLATVPLTSGLVAHIYGVKYMGTLYGLVFFSHQLGGFMGVWLGGNMYDTTGDYTFVWWIGVWVGVFSAAVHLLVNEKPLNQRPPTRAIAF